MVSGEVSGNAKVFLCQCRPRRHGNGHQGKRDFSKQGVHREFLKVKQKQTFDKWYAICKPDCMQRKTGKNLLKSTINLHQSGVKVRFFTWQSIDHSEMSYFSAYKLPNNLRGGAKQYWCQPRLIGLGVAWQLMGENCGPSLQRAVH
jgi:hypothetical protein